MSTSYRPEPVDAVPWRSLLKVRRGPVRAVKGAGREGDAFPLTDGRNYLWAYKATPVGVGTPYVTFERYAGNSPGAILDWLERTYKCRMVSEYEDDFWGGTWRYKGRNKR